MGARQLSRLDTRIPFKRCLVANVAGAWGYVAISAFYAIAWLSPPGQGSSPVDLRPIIPAGTAFVGVLWSLVALLLAMPSFPVLSRRFRFIVIAPVALSLTVAAVVFARA